MGKSEKITSKKTEKNVDSHSYLSPDCKCRRILTNTKILFFTCISNGRRYSEITVTEMTIWSIFIFSVAEHFSKRCFLRQKYLAREYQLPKKKLFLLLPPLIKISGIRKLLSLKFSICNFQKCWLIFECCWMMSLKINFRQNLYRVFCQNITLTSV